MKFFLARQPIFNRKKQVIGYELLFRSGEENAFFMTIKDEVATAKVIDSSLHTFGILTW